MKKIAILTLFLFLSLIPLKGYSHDIQTRIVGHLTKSEWYPNMIENTDCKSAYDNYLTIAKPMNDCHNFYSIKQNIAIEQAKLNLLERIKGSCADCRMKYAEAIGSMKAYKDQLYQSKESKCPKNIYKQYELGAELSGKEDTVCKACSDKWPGQLGPYSHKPCSNMKRKFK